MMPLTIRRRIEARLAKARERGEDDVRFQCAGVRLILSPSDPREWTRYLVRHVYRNQKAVRRG